MYLNGMEVLEDDPTFGDDPVWAAHRARMDRERRAAEAGMN